MNLLRWIGVIVAVLVAAGALVYAIGAALPRAHVARVEGVVPMPADAVAARIRGVRDYPRWRPGVTVDSLGAADGGVSYVETNDGDRIAYTLTEPQPGRRFDTTITDQTLPFGGRWTFDLESQGSSTRVRIEENGVIRDPLYRFFARFVFGYTSSMQGYLRALGTGEAPPPRP